MIGAISRFPVLTVLLWTTAIGIAQGGDELSDLLSQKSLEDLMIEEPIISNMLTGAQKISLDQLADFIARSNIQVKRAVISANVAFSDIQRTSAVFDPTLSLALGLSRADINNRVEATQKYKTATQPLINQDGKLVDNAVVFPEGPVAYIGYDQPRPAGMWPTMVTASEKPLIGNNDNNLDFKVEFDKASRWGGLFSGVLSVKHKEAYWINNYDARQAGLATWGTYDRPWISSLSFNWSGPFPESKNYSVNANELAVADTISRLRRKKTDWLLSANINDAYVSVRADYWALVRAVKQLETIIVQRKLLLKVVDQAERKRRLGEISSYDKEQLDVELDNIRYREQIYWDDLQLASNKLKRDINYDFSGLLLPDGYLGDIDADVLLADYSGFEVMTAEARKYNPALRAQLIDAQASQVVDVQKSQQIRPDIQFSSRLTARQLNTIYGYSSANESLTNLTNPDSLGLNIAIGYTRPYKQRSVNLAQIAASAHSEAASMQYAAHERRLVRDIKNVRATIQIAKKRFDITKRALNLADDAFVRANRLFNLGDIEAYELVLKSQALLDARLARLNAWLSLKGSQDQLIGLLGMFVEQRDAG